VAWKPVSGLFKVALAVETGQLRGHVVTQNLTFAARRPAESTSAVDVENLVADIGTS
jgi:hypothetical protein